MYTLYMHIYKYIHIYFIYVFVFRCPGSLLLHVVSRSFAVRAGRRAALELRGFSCCGVRALGTWSAVVAARGLSSTGSEVAVHGLGCSTACGLFPDQGSNLRLLHWQAVLKH